MRRERVLVPHDADLPRLPGRRSLIQKSSRKSWAVTCRDGRNLSSCLGNRPGTRAHDDAAQAPARAPLARFSHQVGSEAVQTGRDNRRRDRRAPQAYSTVRGEPDRAQRSRHARIRRRSRTW